MRRGQQWRYDDAGQLVWRRNESAEWHYQYDAAGRLCQVVRTPTAAGAGQGIEPDRVALCYDSAGNLLSEQGVNGRLGYRWDARGRLQALTLPQGDCLQWLYAGAGQASAVKFNAQPVSEFSRDRLHRETGRTQGALTQQRQYDARGRCSWQSSGFAEGPLTRPEAGVLWRVYAYTGRGEPAVMRDGLRGTVHCGYDAEGRLQAYRSRRGAHCLTYDGADNLLECHRPQAAACPGAPVRDNRLAYRAPFAYRYDAWGNLETRRNGLYAQHYRYDADNRLVQARGQGPGGAFEAVYHYDALGRRTRKVVTCNGQAPVTTRFVWEGFRLLQELRDNGTRRTWSYDPAHAWTPLAALEQKGEARAAQIYWLHTDLNSAPLEVTDADGTLRWSGEGGMFGAVQGQTVTDIARRHGAVYDQPLRCAGQYADDETGLHYNVFRYYDPAVGRFTTPDPIGIAGGLNLYQYAPNPLSWIDPLGLSNLPVTYWPPNDGAFGTVENVTLKPGIEIDRYGYPRGKYVSPVNTPYSMRALPPGTNESPYTVYKVMKPIKNASKSKIAPWFGEMGMGTQYKLDNSVQSYIDSGHLKKVRGSKCG